MPEVPTSSEALPTRFQKFSFLFILAVVTGIFLYMLRSFALTVLMAAVFTGLTHPLYKLILKRLKKPPLASAATITVLVVLAVVPIVLISVIAYQEAAAIVGHFHAESAKEYLLDFFSRLQSRYPRYLGNINPQDLVGMAFKSGQSGLQYMLSQGANLSYSLANNVLNFFLMLFTMFYFYMDGPKILARLIRWSPLRDDHERLLIEQFLVVSKATLKGILVIGLIQGTIGALLFFIVGISAPIFLGSLMVFASVVPAMGAGLIWFPAGVVLLFQGRIGAGIAVFLVGVLIIGTVDNLVRPSLVGKDAKLHDLLVLFSTLGGLALFGLPGFIMGPILAALLLTLWTLYEQVFQAELQRNAQTGG